MKKRIGGVFDTLVPTEHEDVFIKKMDLYEDSVEFYQKIGIMPWTTQSFFRMVNPYLKNVGIQSKRMSGNRPEAYDGIIFVIFSCSF